MKKLVAIFAHADDETLLAGHILLNYSRDYELSLIIVYSMNQVRISKVHIAAEILNIKNVIFLNILSDELNDFSHHIKDKLLEIKPNIVLTHSPEGDYGHPEHRKVFGGIYKALQQSNFKDIDLYSLYWNPLLLKLNLCILKIVSKNRYSIRSNEDIKIKGHLNLNLKDCVKIRKKAVEVYSDEINKGPLPMKLLEKSPIWIQKFVFGKAKLQIINIDAN